MRGRGDAEPGGLFKHKRRAVRRVGSGDSCPGSRVEEGFPRGAVSSSWGKEESLKLFTCGKY